MSPNKITPRVFAAPPEVSPLAGRPKPASNSVAASAAQTSEPSVSISKVAMMREAIERGTFKMDAQKVADGLLKSGALGNLKDFYTSTG